MAANATNPRVYVSYCPAPRRDSAGVFHPATGLAVAPLLAELVQAPGWGQADRQAVAGSVLAPGQVLDHPYQFLLMVRS